MDALNPCWIDSQLLESFVFKNYFQPNVLHILRHFFLVIVYLICDSFFFGLVTNLKCKGGKLAYIRLHRNLSDMVDRIWVQWNLVGKHIGLQANKRHQSLFSNRIPEKLQFFPRPHSTLFSCFSLKNIIFHNYLIGTRKSYHFRRNRICFDNLYHIVQLRRLIHIEHLENKSWI